MITPPFMAKQADEESRSAKQADRNPFTWPSARLWSRRVRQVMFSGGMEGAFSFRISAFVLAGFATTSTCPQFTGPFSQWTLALWDASLKIIQKSLIEDELFAWQIVSALQD